MKECYLCGYVNKEDDEVVTTDCDGKRVEVHKECCEANGIIYTDSEGDRWYPVNNYQEPNYYDEEVEEGAEDEESN